MSPSGSFRAVITVLVAAASLAATVAPLPSSAATVTIDDKGSCSSWNWDPTTRTLRCGTGGGTAPNCAAISGPTSGTVGTPITLTANCPGATSFTWTGGSCAGTTTSSCSAASGAPGNVFYMVTGSSTNGTGAPAGYTVNWSTQ